MAELSQESRKQDSGDEKKILSAAAMNYEQ